MSQRRACSSRLGCGSGSAAGGVAAALVLPVPCTDGLRSLGGHPVEVIEDIAPVAPGKKNVARDCVMSALPYYCSREVEEGFSRGSKELGIPTDFRMSYPENDAKPPSYESAMSNNEPPLPMSNVPLTDIPEDGSPPPPAYYPPTTDQMNITPWSLDNITPWNTDPSPLFYQKGRTRALGSLVIVAGILVIALGIALSIIVLYSNTVSSGIPFWGPVIYIIAGAVTLAACQNANLRLIKSSSVLASISCVLSIIAVILNVIDLSAIQCVNPSSDFDTTIYNEHTSSYEGNGSDDYPDGHTSHHNHDRFQDENSSHPQCPNLAGAYAVLSLMLIQHLLLFFASLTIASFGYRSLSEAETPAPEVYVIPNIDVTIKPGAFPEFPGIPQPPPYTPNEVKVVPPN